jgi:hypothetical protein
VDDIFDAHDSPVGVFEEKYQSMSADHAMAIMSTNAQASR